MEQSAQGSGHSHELPELREHLDTALRQRVGLWDGAVWKWGLDSVILVGHSQHLTDRALALPEHSASPGRGKTSCPSIFCPTTTGTSQEGEIRQRSTKP